MTTSEACKDISRARRLLSELGHAQVAPTFLHIDNIACVQLSRDWNSHHKTKHVDVKFHYVKRSSENSTVNLHRVHRTEQLADFLTKSGTASSLSAFRNAVFFAA
jgi:hypothetical protein